MATHKNIKDLKLFKPSNGEHIDILPHQSDFELPIHWFKYNKMDKIRYTCNPITNCPICEYLNQIKSKTRWQKIKERISKLWKLLSR